MKHTPKTPHIHETPDHLEQLNSKAERKMHHVRQARKKKSLTSKLRGLVRAKRKK